ncbi:MAG: hypothetical protein QM706_16750 [Nitrospira sp.]
MSEASADPAPCHQTVQFTYGLEQGGSEAWLWGGTYRWTYSGVLSPTEITHALEHALQQSAGCSSDPATLFLWPRTEVVVSVQEKPYPWHWYGEPLGRLSSNTYFIIPFYINEGGWEFTYHVMHRDRPPKIYTYDITAKQFYWVFLLPLSWMNVFTFNLDKAVQSTTVQFVSDAQRDGYLKKMN